MSPRHFLLPTLLICSGLALPLRAADPAMLKAVKAGDKVKFVPERVNGQFTVTRIEKAK